MNTTEENTQTAVQGYGLSITDQAKLLSTVCQTFEDCPMRILENFFQKETCPFTAPCSRVTSCAWDRWLRNRAVPQPLSATATTAETGGGAA